MSDVTNNSSNDPDRLRENDTPKRKGLLGWRPFTRLQGKLIIPYVILTLLLAAMGIFIITRLVSLSMQDRFVTQIKQASEVAVDAVKRRERSHLEELRVLANTEGVPDAVWAGDTLELERLLLPLILNTMPTLVSVLDANGQELITWGYDSQTGQYQTSSGQDFLSVEAVENVLTGTADTVGDKYTDIVDTTYGPAFVTVVAVPGPDGTPGGAVMIGTLLETLAIDIKTQSYADVVLLNSDPALLVATLPDLSEISGTLEDAAAYAAAHDDPKDRKTMDVDLYGRPYQVMFVPWELRFEDVGWLGVIFTSNFLVSSERTNSLLFSIIFTLSTVGVILIGYFISQHIARPILRLRSMSQAVAAGDLNQQIGLNRSDEIGDLAEAFDVMTDHLRLRTEEAEMLYQESIQRNKELADINARLQATQLQLIQSEKLAAVGQLTAGIVHDVKNPLAVIKGLAELLEDDLLEPEETKNELRVIRESADKASRIVGDLLKFARQSDSEMVAHDLREVIDSSLRLTAYLLRQAHVKLTTQIPDSPVLVAYDSQQVEQVLINMIHNAIQAMPDQGSLTINLTQDGEWAVLSIQDSGSGIAPENLKRIFDPFFTTKPEGEGTGLGLSVSYGIIADHKGKIEVESEIGKGTAFHINLPLAQPEAVS